MRNTISSIAIILFSLLTWQNLLALDPDCKGLQSDYCNGILIDPVGPQSGLTICKSDFLERNCKLEHWGCKNFKKQGFCYSPTDKLPEDAIYECDDIRDVNCREGVADDIKIFTRAVGVIVQKENLKKYDPNNPTINSTLTYNNLSRKLNRNSLKIHPDERFANEISLGECSGFLIEDHVFATAGHCLTKFKTISINKEDFVVVFQYSYSNPATNTKLNKLISYEIKDYLIGESGKATTISKETHDFGIIYLQENQQTYASEKENWVKMDHQFDDLPSPENDHYYDICVIGSPLGTPVKFSCYSDDINFDKTNYPDFAFGANFDAFGGNSGSLVILRKLSKKHREPFSDQTSAIGVLSGGSFDFKICQQCVDSEQCDYNNRETKYKPYRIFRYCPPDSLTYEVSSHISLFKEFFQN